MTDTRNAFIIGAAGTIGQATARILASQDYRLLLADRNFEAVQTLAASLNAADAMVLDATNGQALVSAFRTAAASGPLAAVVLAAGVEGPVGFFEDCDEDAFDAVININIKSVWFGIKESLKVMKPQGFGSIVALSSISGVLATPMMSPYTCSKHAVLGLVKTAAREAASTGVRVNAVCPSPVASDMMKRIDGELARKFPERLGGRADATRSVPMQRYATPEEVAQTIAFLCSDASSFCTGAAYMVDGGITCR